MTVDKDRFCELCSMVFSSPVVARSHYEGKVHAKNLRKQGLQPTDISSLKGAEMPTLPSLTQASTNADQKSARAGGMEPLDPTAATTPSTDVDLRDPNKYCALCAASFNNPQMALQHYNGRKHQRNHTRQELLKELGENVQQANSLTCQMCNVEFDSVEMYQAHMQGNKHQIKEKKVIDLCQSQQKVYSTFADELADYIQVQKARGITPNTSHVLPQPQVDGEKEGEEEEGTNKVDNVRLNKSRPNLPPISNPPHHLHPGSYYPAAGWHPPFQGPPANYSFRGTSCGWEYNFPPPPLPGAGSLQFTSRPIGKRRRRNQSSSSSYTTLSSSSSSSYSSSTSDSDDSEYRHRERKRRIRRNRGERGRRAREEDSGERRRREEDAESEEERRRKRKNHGKGRRQEKKSREEDYEEEGGERVVKGLKPEDPMEKREVHMQAEINVAQGEREQAKPSKLKHRKEKKKMKEKVDTRTEEEKLWDESILGL